MSRCDDSKCQRDCSTHTRKASEHGAPVTTNAAESYREFHAEFNAPHPNIYVFVEILLRQQAATYVTVSSLSKSRTIPRSIREKFARLREPFTDYSVGLQTTLSKKFYRIL